MHTRALLAGIAAVLLLAAGARLATKEFCTTTPVMAAVQTSSSDVFLDKKFSVAPGEKLLVDVGHADVQIRSGNGNQAHVQVTLGGSDLKRSREFAEHLNFKVEKTGRIVSVKTDPPRTNWSWNWGRVEVDVLITVPEVFDADVSVAHGDTEVDRLKGELSFNTAHGDLSIGTLAGSTANITAAHGDVEAQELATEKFSLNTAHGDVHIERLGAADFKISAVHGDVDIDEADGLAEVSSTHGDVEIRFTHSISGEFTSSHGDIDLSAPSSMAADLDFEGPDVDISSGYRFEGTKKHDRIEGKINGGGPRLSARTTHGSISLHAN